MKYLWIALLVLFQSSPVPGQGRKLLRETLLGHIDTAIIKESITKSPDGRTLAVVGRIYNRQYVALNGKQSRSYEGVGAKGVVFSADTAARLSRAGRRGVPGCRGRHAAGPV
jgi:hypothetical protein